MIADDRTPERIRAHYEIERDLAARLMSAGKAERRTLYTSLYDELFRRVPDHPQLTRKSSAEETARYLAGLVRLVGRYLAPGQTFLEVGPGDCALCVDVSRIAGRVYAVDVSPTITERELPANCRVIISDGTSIPVNGIDLAFSNQLMEHLHPDDAAEQLENIHRALNPGGRYVCITPNRLCGPHDVSRGFDREATGFHLREYTYAELVALFRQAGFTRVGVLLGAKGRFFSVPSGPLVAFERVCALLPKWLRLHRPLRNVLFTIHLVATK